jgi:hypothetical protein
VGGDPDSAPGGAGGGDRAGRGFDRRARWVDVGHFAAMRWSDQPVGDQAAAENNQGAAAVQRLPEVFRRW